MDETRVRLQADAPRPLPESIRFSHPGPAENAFNISTSTRLTRLRKEREERWKPFVRDLPAPLRERLALAGRAHPALAAPSGSARRSVHALARARADRPRRQGPAASRTRQPAPRHRTCDLCQEASAKAKLSYDDKIFTRFVLSPRLHLEPWSPWRAQLFPWLEKSIGLPLEKKMQAIRTASTACPSCRQPSSARL